MHNFCEPKTNVDPYDITTINEILKSGWVSIGKHVRQFEEEVAELHDVRNVIACSSATMGLIIAIKAAGWRNKKIAVPAFTWPSTLFALESNPGNVPVFCDIDKKTWLMEDKEGDDGGDADVWLPVDTFGNECHDMPGPAIYDAAHGFGLRGNRGIAEVISLSFTKVVTAMEGGLILTQDDGFADVVRELRRLAGRMEEINAVVALGSLRNWDARRDQELEIIDRYRTGLTFPFREQIVPSATNNSVFSIMFESPHTRNAALSRLRSQGFETKVYYEPMISGLPNTDYVYARILSLPVYPGIVPEQDTIINILNEAAGECTPGMHYMQASGYLETYLQRDA